MPESIIIFISIWLVCEIGRFALMMNVKNQKEGTITSAHAKQKHVDGNKKPVNSSIISRHLAGWNWQNANVSSSSSADSKKRKKEKKLVTTYIAMDCEMVGTGPGGQNDMLARVSIVNQRGDVLLDKYVKPREKVTDYRTSVSGIRPKDIEYGEDFETVQNEVINLLRGKILVGHSISNDLAVLFIKYPNKYIRDTAKYRPLAKLVSNGSTPSLKKLSKVILAIDIQHGEHNSVEDARAVMAIYNRLSADWEKYIKKSNHRTAVRSGRGKS